MKVAFIARSTLYTVPGGDTVQVVQTARQLTNLGLEVDILLSKDKINYGKYDLLHFFNLIRPADILYHSKVAGKPFVISTILCTYGDYYQYNRNGAGAIFTRLPADSVEYLKTVARWILGRDHLSGIDYLWKGQKKSIIELLNRANIILPNSESELKRVKESYPNNARHVIIANGINPERFPFDPSLPKDENLVLCVARIEGRKNQLNLIRALNNTRFKLVIIGAPAPNQLDYYHQCQAEAAANVSFAGRLPHEELISYLQRAKVHILPSWFETTGLSSIEATVMHCNIVITDKGDTRDYFGKDAIYCEPESTESILRAVVQAGKAPFNKDLLARILKNYTWKQAAQQTLKAYKTAVIA
ncbi:glycosyltransferase family 4 protein [Mucilaginibacter sp. L3T2-6]|uniref:glycosyltransferase family 4 protein n=1 Tax=Mucilaginibacter sp. L3T2-6 TaxID=3062491 RepID=UPI0026763C60|nr:glycosyltransferase family 4 protein [Mucilaginibacter sp. L3T2-6]MDO3643396.1 glycosyltransferase family 4 protein [Mucilaginibacter sp. L3T2-6]MDV6215671.1 glycosyltransferase family 4 protein [Mucilaginibacter sp. L3T2-6]